MTPLEALRKGEARLHGAQVEQPAWNAERLLLLAIGIDRAQLYSDLQRPLSNEEIHRFERLIEKRSSHYPLAYMEGVQEFYGREFEVTEAVLIPRPETEEIIRAALKLPLPSSVRIADLGAGSGNLAVTLALEIPGSRVVAIELSAPAIQVLRKNARQYVALARSDLFAPPFLPASFDLVVSNLPYVEEATFEHLPAETRCEPRIALVTRALEESYRRLLQTADRLLRRDGYVIFEIGYLQSSRIQAVCAANDNFQLLEIRADQQSIPRTFVLQKR